MLKMIKSNAIFALILLLSIPAQAAQPAQKAQNPGQSKVTFFAKYGAKLAEKIAFDYLFPSWRTVKTVVCATSAGIKSAACVTFNGAKTALGYISPVVHAPLTLASHHPYITGAFVTVLALAYAGNKAYNWYVQPRAQKAVTASPATPRHAAMVTTLPSSISSTTGQPVPAPVAASVPQAAIQSIATLVAAAAPAAVPQEYPQAERREERVEPASPAPELATDTASLPVTSGVRTTRRRTGHRRPASPLQMVIRAAQKDIDHLGEYMQAGLEYHNAQQRRVGRCPQEELEGIVARYNKQALLPNCMRRCRSPRYARGGGLTDNIEKLCAKFVGLHDETAGLLSTARACKKNAEQFKQNIVALQAILGQLGQLQAESAAPAAQ
jgi:hypothetical protein